MENLIQRFQTVKQLAVKYGLPADTLERSILDLSHFQLTVPVIGSFNTGKSSMLNALLEAPLLPTDIRADTSVPTEITYGDNFVLSQRGTQTQRVGIGELRHHTLDLEGVTLLQLRYRHPFLQQISSIKLVDMPGLDSGVLRHDEMLRGYLPQSLAYLLVFSADEPVVKESVVRFLSELRLREIPVFVVLTKCDKVTPEDQQQARRFLKKSLERLFGLSRLEICCVSARESVEPVAALLLRLQERAAQLEQTEFSAQLQRQAATVRSYLSLRLAAEDLPVSELGGRLQSLSTRMERLTAAIWERQSHFMSQETDCKHRILTRVTESLNATAEPLATMLLTGQDAALYADEMLRATVSTVLIGMLEPLMHGYIKSVSAVLEMNRLADANESEVGCATRALRRMTASRAENGTLFSTLEASIEPPDSTQPILDELMAELVRTTPHGAKRTERIAELVRQQLLPALAALAEQCINEDVERCDTAVRTAIEDAVSQEYETRQRALKDLRTQKQSDDARRQCGRSELTDDLAALDALTCESELSATVG